jgi:hypothetical protein
MVGRIRRPPGLVGAVDELFASLHTLHLHAGEPSMQQLAEQTAVLSHDTVYRVLAGPAVPKWGPLELVVEVLHGDVDKFRALWLAASGQS